MPGESHLTFTILPAGWAIEGELDRHNVAALNDWYRTIVTVQGQHTLELAGLEILDAAGSTAAIECIRQLLRCSSTLTVTHAPHLLAHTLYRIGMLEPGSRLSLVAPRQEEPYG